MGGSIGKDQIPEDKETSQNEALNSTLSAVEDHPTGGEQKEGFLTQKGENWWKVQEGDTLWGLSQKHLGDPTQWRHLQAACNLGSDPLVLLPGAQITEACVAKAQKQSMRK